MIEKIEVKKVASYDETGIKITNLKKVIVFLLVLMAKRTT